METFDLVCLSHLRWDSAYQRPHHLMGHAAAAHRVFFFEEPLFDEDAPRCDTVRGSNGVTVITPHLPDKHADDIAGQLRGMLDAVMAEQEICRYVLWYYTPMALDFTRHLRPISVVYDCMDELSAFREAPPLLAARELELFERADLVFCGGQSLFEAKQLQHPSVHLFPSSVDARHFGRARVSTEDPIDQWRIPHPRLGYFGAIDERLDLDLIAGLADARPDWHLVLVGPVTKIEIQELPDRPNIHYLGAKPYKDLPAYLGEWDVAIMPFVCNDSTRYISPTKTPEYLSGGKPVVSTPIRDVVRPYGALNLVGIASGIDGWVEAVERALAAPEADRLDRVDAFLARMSWARTWQGMTELIETVIETRQDGQTVRAPDAPTVEVTGGSASGFDYLVVGAGFAGSVLAERLASQANKRVLVVDVRPHIGGNAYDHHDDHGVLVHRYGPHIFHTNADRVVSYLSQFTEWRPYQHRVRASVDGRLLPIPINLDTVNELYGLKLSSFELKDFFASVAEPVETVRTSEDVVVSAVGRDLYEKFFRGYTRKQWGMDPSELDAAVTARVPTRTNRDDRYFTDTYQAMPLHGYTRMFERMLEHPNISIMLQTDYRDIAGLIPYREMIYTGPIDAYFDFRFGRLPYRSLEFRFESRQVEWAQEYPVINYPNDYDYTRVTELKYLTGQTHDWTTLVSEYPRAEGDPYYPVPTRENADLYRRYKTLADQTPGVHFVGRLATYKYYNMDQVVAQALATFDRIMKPRPEAEIHDIDATAIRSRVTFDRADGYKTVAIDPEDIAKRRSR